MEVQEEEEEAGLPPRRWLALAVSRNSVVYFNFSLSLTVGTPHPLALWSRWALSSTRLLWRACSGRVRWTGRQAKRSRGPKEREPQRRLAVHSPLPTPQAPHRHTHQRCQPRRDLRACL